MRKPRTKSSWPTTEEIRAQLDGYNREPFLKTLAVFMACAPDPESILAFANKAPDRWAQAVTMLAKLYGFTEKLDINHNHMLLDARSMSNGQLLEALAKLRDGMVLSLEPEPVSQAVKLLTDSSNQNPT